MTVQCSITRLIMLVRKAYIICTLCSAYDGWNILHNYVHKQQLGPSRLWNKVTCEYLQGMARLVQHQS